ncbi:hypothetical protein, partial [Paenibacillus cisolokensis]|uniref:hypothetical protein n=1 Tax=Paenibacillus cisolokensis TaxID=1658519 RepID=UPI001BCD200C
TNFLTLPEFSPFWEFPPGKTALLQLCSFIGFHLPAASHSGPGFTASNFGAVAVHSGCGANE